MEGATKTERQKCEVSEIRPARQTMSKSFHYLGHTSGIVSVRYEDIQRALYVQQFPCLATAAGDRSDA
jgi:hypothetical protein